MSIIRTCVVCRQKSEKATMLRVVMACGVVESESGCLELGNVAGSLVAGSMTVSFDLLQELPGRGCYVHASSRCLLSERLWPQIKQRLCRKTGRSKKSSNAVDVKNGKCCSTHKSGQTYNYGLTSNKQLADRVTERVAVSDGRCDGSSVNEANLRTSGSGGIVRQVYTCFDPAKELEKALSCAKRGIAAKNNASRKEEVAIALYAKLCAKISGDICSVKASSTSEHLSSMTKQRIKHQRIKLIL